MYSKTCVKRPLSKRQKIGFQDQLSLNAGQKYCKMLQGEHSAILLTFIKLPFVLKIFVLSIFERPFYTGLTVVAKPLVLYAGVPELNTCSSSLLDETLSSGTVSKLTVAVHKLIY